jgi:hypothetical protein
MRMTRRAKRLKWDKPAFTFQTDGAMEGGRTTSKSRLDCQKALCPLPSALCLLPVLPSGDQPQLLTNLHCLSSSFGTQLIEQPAGMSLHGVLAYEELFSNLAIAHPLCNQLKYL